VHERGNVVMYGMAERRMKRSRRLPANEGQRGRKGDGEWEATHSLITRSSFALAIEVRVAKVKAWLQLVATLRRRSEVSPGRRLELPRKLTSLRVGG
jgi:hypothetical protein